MEFNVLSVHPKHALAVYAEPLVAGGRVAVFGDSSLNLGARLMSLGAAAVQVWDPDRARARIEADRACRGVTVSPYSSVEAAGRLVDVVIVPELGMFDDAVTLLARVRDVAGDEGVAVIAAANRDVTPVAAGRPAFDYYELFDLVAKEFSGVRMVAQLPFHGVVLIPLGQDEEPTSVSLDTQLADGDRAAESFVVLASQKNVHLDPYTIVEIPTSAALPTADALDDVTLAAVAEANEEMRAEVAEALRQLATLETQNLELKILLAASDEAVSRGLELDVALRERTGRVAELEKEVTKRRLQLTDLSGEVEELRAAADAGRIAAAEVEQIARRADRAERRVSVVESELAGIADVHAAELDRFEGALRDRARIAQSLEAEVKRRESLVRELLSALDEATTHPSPNPPPESAAASPAFSDGDVHLRTKLDALALELARREGEAQAAKWTVQELERRLAEAQHPIEVPSAGDAAAVLPGVLDELDVLRKALAQEHEARIRAESGDELRRARAEIERQGALLAQRSRERSGEMSGETTPDIVEPR